MSVYAVRLTVRVHADNAQDARDQLEKPLDELFATPCVVELEAEVPEQQTVYDGAAA